jgi:hypothetical protein
MQRAPRASRKPDWRLTFLGDPKKFHAEARATFLEYVAKYGVIALGAQAAGVSSQTCYKARRDDPDFAAAWDEALERHADACEREAYRRAVEGVDEPVFWQGEECGAVRKYSDRLLSERLQSRRPEAYRHNVSVDAKVDAKISTGVLISPFDEPSGE